MIEETSTPTGDDRSVAGSPATSAAPSPAAGADTPPAAGADTPPAAGADARPEGRRWRRHRRLIWIGVAVAAVVVVLVCAGLGAFAAGVGRLTREADRTREAHHRAEAACLALERRLNRLVPPAATAGPGQRAAAIRDENAAVRPFLAEVEQVRGRWHGGNGDDPDDDRPGWAESWRELMDARTSYADALDRQVTSGEPAFFVAPQDRRGRPLLDRLQRWPATCAGSARRLAAPDL